jgi:hypothetical protein
VDQVRVKSKDYEWVLITKDENKYRRDAVLPLQESAFEVVKTFIPAYSLRILEDKYGKEA